MDYQTQQLIGKAKDYFDELVSTIEDMDDKINELEDENQKLMEEVDDLELRLKGSE